MIIVTVGTSSTPFDRLVRAAGTLETGEDVIVQHGASSERPRATRCVAALPGDELAALMQTARVVVTHCGVGSILGAISAGRTPVVVPRLAALGEAVDDHQLELARRLAELGLVTVVEDVAELPDAIAAAVDRGSGRVGTRLVQELASYLIQCVGRAPAADASATGA